MLWPRRFWPLCWTSCPRRTLNIHPFDQGVDGVPRFDLGVIELVSGGEEFGVVEMGRLIYISLVTTRAIHLGTGRTQRWWCGGVAMGLQREKFGLDEIVVNVLSR